MTPPATVCFAFLSTPSGWRATTFGFERNVIEVWISIHALRVEGDHICLVALQNNNRPISIHALRVEGDVKRGSTFAYVGISIHALRVEGDSKNGQSFHLFLRKREKNLPL